MVSVTGTVTRAQPQGNLSTLLVTTPATTDPGDTCAIDLTGAGISVFVGIRGFVHTTLGSVVVISQPTTAVSAGTLTITLPTGDGNTDKARAYIIYGFASNDTNITAP